MSTTSDAAFGASGPLGPYWLDTSRFPLSDDDLQCLVVSAGSSLTALEVHQLYGHWMTRTAMAQTVGW
jgi:hypothetical protein